MIHEHLDVLNDQLDETALNKRLSIEAEHLKRIKCTKTLRIYTDPTGNTIKINTRIINDCNMEGKTELWELVKRVVLSINTSIPTIDEELARQGLSPTGSAESEGLPEVISNITVQEQDIHSATSLMPSEPTGDGSQEGVEYSGTSAGTPTNGPIDAVKVFEWTDSTKAEGFSLPLLPEYKKIQLLIKLKNSRNVYKLSKGIQELFGKYSNTIQNVIKDFYKYVNTHHLNEYSSGNVVCNDVLENLFGVKSFSFGDISSLVAKHLEPIGYCVINLSLDKREIWDIQMEADDLAHMPVLYPKNVHEMEKKIEATQEVAKRLDEHIGVLEEFVKCPVFFVNRKIALESEGFGSQTAFYDSLGVQTAVFELIKKYEATNSNREEKRESSPG